MLLGERTPLLSQEDGANYTFGSGRQYQRTTSESFAEKIERNTSLILFLQQFYAMFVKRALHTLRNKIVTFVQLAVPLFFTITSLIVIKTFPGPHDSPSLNLTIEKLGENFVAYALPLNVTGEKDLVRMASFYSNQFRGNSETHVNFVNNDTRFMTDPNLTNYLLQQGQDGIGDYNLKFMVAADFQSSHRKQTALNVTAYFNNQAYHTPAITIGVLTNSIMQYIFNNSNLWIETANHPLPRTMNEKINDEMTKETTGFTLAFNIVFGMSFLASSFVLFLIKERATKAKHLQFTSGVSLSTFWCATFIWDVINYLMTAVCLVLVIWGFNVDAYIVKDHVVHIALLFLLYGFAMLPFMYLWSFLFTIPATGYVWLTMFNILSGEKLIFQFHQSQCIMLRS